VTRRSHSRPRSQSGYTLIELLQVVALSGVIFVPLMAWTGLAIQQQPVIQDGILRTASAGLLGAYFPKDVAVAGKATVFGNGTPPSWANDCGPSAVPAAQNQGSGGELAVAMIAGGTEVFKVVYSAAPAADNPLQQSLWRRTCNAATNQLIDATQVYPDIQPGSTVSSCTSELADEPCRQMEISVTPRSTNRAVTVRATRRVDEGALPTDISGVAKPTAVIQITSQQGVPLVVGLSAARSSVGVGRTAQYQWEFNGPSAVSVTSSTAETTSATFAQPGFYSVILTVTDDLGNTNRTYQQISTTNQAPTAVAAVSPLFGSSSTVFTLNGSGSVDPDGTIAAYDWIVEYPSPDGVVLGTQITTTGKVASVTPPAGVFGTANVTLIVTDSQGAQDSTYASFQIANPSGPTTTVGPGGSTTTTVNPSDPSGLSVSFTNSAGEVATEQSFNASATTGIGAGNTASYLWELGDGAQGFGVAPSHNYPNDGQYNVRVTVTTSDARTATTVRVVNVGGAAPPPAPSVVDGVGLVWSAVPGARRYLADFEWRTDTDCFEQLINQQVAASPVPRKAIPANPCSRFATSRARVGTDANGSVSWSEWIAIPLVGP
jgi:PKD repeat protein